MTHSDNYIDEIKKTNRNWKDICREKIAENKINLLNFVNKIIEEKDSNFKMDKNEILHTLLIDIEKISNDDIISKMEENIKELYDKSNEEIKKAILDSFRAWKESRDKEVSKFIEEIGVLGHKELINKIKEKLPF